MKPGDTFLASAAVQPREYLVKQIRRDEEGRPVIVARDLSSGNETVFTGEDAQSILEQRQP